jgi:hypothetical protein
MPAAPVLGFVCACRMQRSPLFAIIAWISGGEYVLYVSLYMYARVHAAVPRDMGFGPWDLPVRL